MMKMDNPLAQCQLKFKGDGLKAGELTGYLSVFGNVDSDGDIMVPGAFAGAVGKNLKMFINHDSFNIPVGDWMDLREDDVGLFAKGVIDMNHRDGPSLHSALMRGAMDGISVGFRRVKSEEREYGNGFKLLEVDLKEASVVNYPANEAARVQAVKADFEVFQTLKEAEMVLRDAGTSRAFAKAHVSRVRELVQRDAESDLKDEIARLKQVIAEKDTLLTKLEAEVVSKTLTRQLVDSIHNM